MEQWLNMFILVMQFNISFNSGINIFIHVIVLASNYNARNCNYIDLKFKYYIFLLLKCKYMYRSTIHYKCYCTE